MSNAIMCSFLKYLKLKHYNYIIPVTNNWIIESLNPVELCILSNWNSWELEFFSCTLPWQHGAVYMCVLFIVCMQCIILLVVYSQPERYSEGLEKAQCITFIIPHTAACMTCATVYTGSSWSSQHVSVVCVGPMYKSGSGYGRLLQHLKKLPATGSHHWQIVWWNSLAKEVTIQYTFWYSWPV